MSLFLRITKEAWDKLALNAPHVACALTNACIEVRYAKKYRQYLFWGIGATRELADSLLLHCRPAPDSYRLIYQRMPDENPEVNAGRLNGHPFFLGIKYHLDYIRSGRNILKGSTVAHGNRTLEAQ